MGLRSALIAAFALCGCFSADSDADPRRDAAPADGDGGRSPDAAQDVAQDAGGGSDFVPGPSCSMTTDCASDELCVVLGPELTGCTDRTIFPNACMPNVAEECCVDADCDDGLCVGALESAGACGGTAGAIVRNRCVSDQCDTDADCAAGEMCASGNRAELKECIAAACRSDDDCTEHAGGRCVLLDLDCCLIDAIGGVERRAELACAYPGIGCETDADCLGMGLHCVVRDGRAECGDCQ